MQEEIKEIAGQPEEVVDWYVPKSAAPQEVVDCYVHTQPLPQRIAPVEKQKKKHRGLKYFLWTLVALGVALGAGIAYGYFFGQKDVPTMEDDSSASSIIHVFNDDSTSIPRADLPEALPDFVLLAPTEELTAQEVYEKANPSTVIVLAGQGDKTAVGTGVIMSSDGYVITNAHVIAGASSASVVLYDRYLLEAELVGYDVDADIAVLKAKDAEDLPTATFGNSDLCRVGDSVYAIGNPLGVSLTGTMTEGILSAINRDVQLDGRTLTLLQTTAALNNGNSGGPLINSCGQVIGINTLKMGTGSGASTAQVEGLGFALPISDVRFVVNDILSTGAYHGTPTFGMMVQTWKTVDDSDILVIINVTEGGAAEKAGLQEGDIILRVNGQSVSTSSELLALRRECAVGDTVSLLILRNNTRTNVSLTLESSRK